MRKITRRRKSKKEDKIEAIKHFDLNAAVSYNPDSSISNPELLEQPHKEKFQK